MCKLSPTLSDMVIIIPFKNLKFSKIMKDFIDVNANSYTSTSGAENEACKVWLRMDVYFLNNLGFKLFEKYLKRRQLLKINK